MAVVQNGIIAFLVFIVYFFPALLATFKRHRFTLPIWLMVVFLGWTIIGWIGAMIWAITNPKPKLDAPGVIKTGPNYGGVAIALIVTIGLSALSALGQKGVGETQAPAAGVADKEAARTQSPEALAAERMAVEAAAVAKGARETERAAEKEKKEQAVAASNFHAAMMVAVRDNMKDPSSTQFRQDTVYRGSGSMVLCGEINAKNSFGGYVGFTPFMASPAIGFRQPQDFKAGEFQKSWKLLCHD